MPVLVFGDERLEYDLTTVTNKDAMALQKVVGMKWGEWIDALSTGDVEVLTGLVWLVRRMNGQQVRWDDVEFTMPLRVEQTDVEKAESERLEKAAADVEASPTKAEGRRPSARSRGSRTSGAKASSS